MIYEGGFESNLFDGLGILNNSCKPSQVLTEEEMIQRVDLRDNHWVKYEGTFKSGKKEGVGHLFFGNGLEFLGEFQDDGVHGVGVFTRKDGSKVCGVWAQGTKQPEQ